jgi:hypothetical protein
MVIVAVPPPEILVAVIVYVLALEVTVGVPDITPVEVFKDKPAGKDGLIDQLAAAPPVLVGVSEAIAAPTV